MIRCFLSIILFLVSTTFFVSHVTGSDVSVGKECFRKGELITAKFDNITGTGIWIGLYPKNRVSDFTNLPGFAEGYLSSWVLSCGTRDNCIWWPQRGEVHFPTDELDYGDYVVVVSGDRAGLDAQAHTETFTVGTNCFDITIPTMDRWIAPGDNDQRSPCPFVNALSNHGFLNRNGTFVDLLDMADKMELIYNVDAGFLRDGPIQLAIDCNQTYEDESGNIRIDIDRLFDDNCEEHEASMFRADSFFGFNKSKQTDDTLLNNLIRINPSSDVLNIEDIMGYQADRIMESRLRNPETEFRDFDIDNMGAQGVFLFLLSSDPTLTTVEKDRLYFFLLMERLPSDFLPGSLRDTPFNPKDETDFIHDKLMQSMANVEIMMHTPIDEVANLSPAGVTLSRHGGV